MAKKEYLDENGLSYLLSKLKNFVVNSIPKKISFFENDIGYAKATEIPTKVSQLENDSEFVTRSDLPPAPDLSGYATKVEVNQNIEASSEKLQQKIDFLEHALYDTITSNPFEITFENLDGFEFEGLWNKELKRIEV